ncbi:MAG: glycoside hydrolase family 2 protein [Planctomycetota bacterium]
MPLDFQHRRTLCHGWWIRASRDITASADEVSTLRFDANGWSATAVPATVLAALVADGQYKDPYFGMNLKQIPEELFEGMWWYRTEFSLFDQEAAMTVLLEFDGINYAADIWLNGQQIATAEVPRGAYRRFQFDVSDTIAAGENVLAITVIPPQPGDFSTGFVDWNPPAPDRNMGLFRPVRLRFCHGVSIENLFVQTQLNVETLAEADLTVLVDLINHSSEPASGVLEGRIEAAHFSQTVNLEPGERKTVIFTPETHQGLHITDPRLWWPYEMGTPELYQLDLQFSTAGQVSDVGSIRFGIRDVADYWTTEGHRGFRINGHDVLIKAAGWTDDLLLADTPERIEAQLRYVRHMNLNCIRCEGIWGTDQTLYDLCDEYGILMMVGWSCHWEHEQYLGKPVDERYGGIVSPEDIDLVSQSWEDQLLWLRYHPSIFAWAVASDKVPAPDLERRYIETFQKHDPTRPYLASTGGVGSEQKIIGSEEIVSDVSGGSGVKMLGPYAYTPPVYWYTDTKRGGAYGFNTETSPGAVVPTLESLRKMIPADHLWPIDAYWDFHCGLNEFDRLDRFREAVRRRYGEAENLEAFARRAQVLNYELARPMFEAFRVNKGRATGVVQWMLNAAWPKMYWQLYDWYLTPTGAFYATRNACASPQLIYHYGDNSIHLVNDQLVDFSNLRAEVRLYDIESKLFLYEHFQVVAERESTRRVTSLPSFANISTAHFLNLRLVDAQRRAVASNFYWLSTRPDVLDDDARVEPWEYYTPSQQYADLTQLNSLRPAELGVKLHGEPGDRKDKVTVELENQSDMIAFFIELLLLDGVGEPVVPIFWQDNFVSLLPNETRTLRAAFPGSAEKPALIVRGWNIAECHHVL